MHTATYARKVVQKRKRKKKEAEASCFYRVTKSVTST